MTDDPYDDAFFAGNLNGPLRSARIIFPWLIERIHPKTVIDVGCGMGVWAFIAKENGCDIRAVDGYVGDRVLVPEAFEGCDLVDGYSCAGYDLSICLEVGEHLPASAAPNLVSGLCEATYVLWSAAPPFQGGSGHINEQWPTWWEPYFAECGYVGSPDIRRPFWDDDNVELCYRQNMIVWAKPDDLTAAGLAQGTLNEAHPLLRQCVLPT